MALYGRVEYWNERYSLDKEPFEWYQQYSGIRHLLTNEILSHMPEQFPAKPQQRVLVMGCGNSQLSQQMLEDGYTCNNVVSVDYASVVIQQMKEKYPHASDSYRIMNVASRSSGAKGEGQSQEGMGMATFDSDSFDMVLLKGTFDSLLCGAGSIFDIRLIMMECSRVLGEHGALVIVTHATSENRLAYFEDPAYGWTIDVHKVPKPPVPGVGAKPPSSSTSTSSSKPAVTEPPKYHHVYILRKGGHPEPAPEQQEPEQDTKMPAAKEQEQAEVVAEETITRSASPPPSTEKFQGLELPAAPQDDKVLVAQDSVEQSQDNIEESPPPG
jgi:SAM-dependent methyltransferase